MLVRLEVPHEVSTNNIISIIYINKAAIMALYRGSWMRREQHIRLCYEQNRLLHCNFRSNPQAAFPAAVYLSQRSLRRFQSAND